MIRDTSVTRLQRARSAVLAGCVLALCALTPAVLAAQLDVDQFEVFVNSAGRDREGSFRVRNVSAAPITARLILGDWTRRRDGTNEFPEAGAVEGACARDVKVFPAVASLAPGESQVVRVTYDGPAQDTMCWAAVMVGLAPQAGATSGGASIAAEVRSAVKVYVNPVTPAPDVRIESIDLGARRPRLGEPAADTAGMDVIAELRNHGNVHVRAKVRLEYRSATDSIVARAQDLDVPMLPGATREWRSTLPNLTVGRYVVLLVVDFGGAELVAAQLDLDVTP